MVDVFIGGMATSQSLLVEVKYPVTREVENGWPHLQKGRGHI